MDGISNIFKGKVMGSEHVHTPEETVQELNVVKKIKALEEGHMKNLTENHKMKMFGLTERMKVFSNVKPKNTFQPATDKLYALGIINKNENFMSPANIKNYKMQEKMQSINAKAKLESLGIFPKAQNVKQMQFSELMPRGQNISGLPQAQNIQNMRGTVFNQEINSWNTIKQRRGLNPFDDTDKDGVLNFLDCKPLNKKKQGWMDNQGIYHDDTGEVAPIPETQYQATIDPMTKVAEVDSSTLRQKIMSGVGAAIQNTRVPSYIPGTESYNLRVQNKKTQKEWEAEIRKKAMEEAVAKGYELKGKKIYQQQENKTLRGMGIGTQIGTQKVFAGYYDALGNPVFKTQRLRFDAYGSPYGSGRYQPTSGIGQTNYALMRGARDISMGFDAAVNPMAKQRIRELTGLGGSPGTIKGILSMDQAGLPLYVKVDEWYGKGEKAKRYYENAPAIQQASISPPTQQSIPTQQYYTQAQSTYSTGGTVLSPYSKRRVQYTRGPYRSHKMAVQPQSY